MGLNAVPSGERVHIGFFGRRNAGKSSLVNAVTGQEISVVSDVRGTTTDPVTKSMELLPLGPVVIIDTPGFDDEGALGEKRVARAKRVMNRTDLAVLVLDAQTGMSQADIELLALFKEKQIPYLVVCNKADLLAQDAQAGTDILYVSAKTGQGIHDLKEKIAALGTAGAVKKYLIEDLIEPSEVVLLVIPIDKAAPKGRLILPQQMMIRGILDADGIPVCVKQDRLPEVLEKLGENAKPGLVIMAELHQKIIPEKIHVGKIKSSGIQAFEYLLRVLLRDFQLDDCQAAQRFQNIPNCPAFFHIPRYQIIEKQIILIDAGILL